MSPDEQAQPADKSAQDVPTQAKEPKPEAAKPASAPKPSPKPASKTKKEPAAQKGPAKTSAKKAAPKEAVSKTSTAKESAQSKEKPSGDDVEIVEKSDDARKKREHKARLKPTLSDDVKRALQIRQAVDDRRPAFRRQQWFEYKKLARSGWRVPRGGESAMRMHMGYRPNVPSIGFRGPAAARGLHSSGFAEVRVMNVDDLAKIDAKTQAARVGGGVGKRKLKFIYEEADKLGIRVLNRREIA